MMRVYDPITPIVCNNDEGFSNFFMIFKFLFGITTYGTLKGESNVHGCTQNVHGLDFNVQICTMVYIYTLTKHYETSKII